MEAYEIKEKLDELMAELIKADKDEANSFVGSLIDDLKPQQIIDLSSNTLDHFLDGLNSDDIASYMHDEVMDLSDDGIENLFLTAGYNSVVPHDELIEMCYKDFDIIIHRIDTQRALEMLSTIEESYHFSYRVA